MKQLLIISTLLFAIACQNAKPEKETEKEAKSEVVVRGEAQGTTYTVKYIADNYEKGIKERLDSLLNVIDKSMSTYVPNSLISRLNAGDTVVADRMFKEVYQLSKEIHKRTSGAFDPTIGPLIKAWGFDYANPQKMDSAIVNQLLIGCGFKNFKWEEDKVWKADTNSRINFNAVAQGYSVDLMAGLLEEYKIENYYVELGGELKVKGKNKFGDWWVIGIDSPKGENLERTLTERVSLKNAAMATSGNYRKFYEVDGKKYSHTLDPITGYPAENSLLSATVVTKNCGEADAIATALMVMGVEKAKTFLAERKDVQAHLIFAQENGNFGSFTTEKLKSDILEN